MSHFSEKLYKKIATSKIVYPTIFKKLPADISEYLDAYQLPYDHIDYEGGFVTIGENSIFVQSFSKGDYKNIAFLFHGLFDHAGYFSSIIPLLLELGYRVIVWDQMGFGFSSGERSHCKSFGQQTEIAEFLVEKFSSKEHVNRLFLGHSAGCSQLLDLIRHQKISQKDQVILLCPLVRCAKWKWVKLAYFLVGKILKQVPRKFKHISNDADFVNQLKNDVMEDKHVKVSWVRAMIRWEASLHHYPTPIGSVLVIQGDKDETVDWEYNLLWLKQKFSNLKEVVVEGAYHHIHNESSKYKTICLNKIKEYLSHQ